MVDRSFTLSCAVCDVWPSMRTRGENFDSTVGYVLFFVRGRMCRTRELVSKRRATGENYATHTLLLLTTPSFRYT